MLKKALIVITLFIAFSGFTGDPPQKPAKVFPKPENIPNMMFYVQRTFNINTIIYELNINEKGELKNVEEPFNIHWVNYASDKSSEGLNYIQRKYAYGLDVKLLDAEKQTYVFNFVSYKKKKIYLMKSPIDNKFHAFCDINNRLVCLNRVFIQIEGGTFWVPHVVYIEISGTDIAKNNELVVERVIPKQ